MSGKFIVLEGSEGVGLEKLAQDLVPFLKRKGLKDFQIHLTREPSDGPIGRDIRLALKGRLQLDPQTLAVLFAADRLDHLQVPKEGIETHLQEGHWVICDRYYLSQYAYQTYQGFDLQWLRDLNRFARRPDIIFYIELPLDVSAKNYLAQRRRGEYHYTLAPDEDTVKKAKGYITKIQTCYSNIIKELKGEEPIVVIQAANERDAGQQMQRELRRLL